MSTSPFRPGDWVRVKSASEVMETLDDAGKLGGLPFMPEMLALCDQQFRVEKIALKTCEGGVRPISGMVHLADTRCSGCFHAQCDSACTFYWKTEWLRHAKPGQQLIVAHPSVPEQLAKLMTWTKHEDQERFVCQATELLKIDAAPLRVRRLRWYIRDFRSGNVGVKELKTALWWCCTFLNWRTRLFFHRPSQAKPPDSPPRSFAPGDLVRVLSKSQIMRTLNRRSRHKGLEFSADMARFCGKQFRVKHLVEHVIEPVSGKMKTFKNPSVILEGVTCSGACHFCPRQMYHFWREIWLDRTDTQSPH